MYKPLFAAVLTAGALAPMSPTPAQPAQACLDFTYLPATMSPCQGPPGQSIRVRLRKPLGAAPRTLAFRGLVRGAPAEVRAGLKGSGLDYATTVPDHLCMAPDKPWEARLVLADGRDLGVIGAFRPVGCA